MAKTYPWSTIVPAGSEQAATADDHIRRLRLEIEERMSDIVTDWSADPVELKPETIGLREGKLMLIHGSAFTIEPDESNQFEYGDTGITIASAVGPTRANVVMARGVTIKKIRWLVTNGDTAPLTLVLKAADFATGVLVTTICTMTTVLAGAQIVDSASVSPFEFSVPDDKMFFLSADKGGGAQFSLHGVEITYNTPDSGSTL